MQCLRHAGLSGSVFVWLASSVMGDFAKLSDHARMAEELLCAVAAAVYQLLAAELPAMEQHADMTREVLDLVARGLRRFPHVLHTPMFQTSLQFALVTLFFCPPIFCNSPAHPKHVLIHE